LVSRSTTKPEAEKAAKLGIAVATAKKVPKHGIVGADTEANGNVEWRLAKRADSDCTSGEDGVEEGMVGEK
jgi:hypothetical protein